MYITYDTNQIGYGQPPLSNIKKQNNNGPFRPTWLIRMSDLVKVPGKEVTETGYCALSYAWTWSGEKFTNETTGHPEVRDEGKHKIITTVQKDNGTVLSRDVKFESLLQQICQDFKVEYLWFDRWCVDINNEEEKVESLKQMYLTYSHADYAIALVPEMEIIISNNKNDLSEQQRLVQVLEHCLDQIIQCEWTKRVWLLVEAMMSKRLLFLGKDVHMWSDGLGQYASSLVHSSAYVSLEAIQSLSGQQKDACKVLWHAHRRATTFDHDRIFALINIYSSSTTSLSITHNIGRDMPITYKPALKDYMIQFYKKLIMVDWTMLCFGKQQKDYPNEMVKFATFMPSWTGVLGTHIQHATMSQLSQKEENVVATIDEQDDNKSSIRVQCKSVLLDSVNSLTNRNDVAVDIQEKLEKRYGITFTHHYREILLSLTQEKDLGECIILNIPFVWQECVIRPVIIKNSEYYRSIGISSIPHQGDQKVGLDNFGSVSEDSIFIIQ
ncbi:hypothetical protein BDC45DRAFT_541811 [Circinella umbellata]|nr:hypothetical protein BDC45DRAFT_541811 [Circinella umbellata]